MHPCEVPGKASIRTETSKLIIQIDLGARKGTGSASVEVWADCWQLVPCVCRACGLSWEAHTHAYYQFYAPARPVPCAPSCFTGGLANFVTGAVTVRNRHRTPPAHSLTTCSVARGACVHGRPPARTQPAKSLWSSSRSSSMGSLS